MHVNALNNLCISTPTYPLIQNTNVLFRQGTPDLSLLA